MSDLKQKLIEIARDNSMISFGCDGINGAGEPPICDEGLVDTFMDGAYSLATLLLDDLDKRIKYENERIRKRVIEYSAVESRDKLIQELVEALEFYAKAPANEKLFEIAPKFREPAQEALNSPLLKAWRGE